jgi:NADPH:quinone reductase-like Zn-dependent oxidoreductase
MTYKNKEKNMKAIVYEKYGSYNNLKYVDTEKPIPSEIEVLVKIYSASINKADLLMLQGKPFPLRLMTGIFKPKRKILGTNISGEIVEVGSKNNNFKVGDMVFGELGIKSLGGYAEYLTTIGNGLFIKPNNVSHDEAAAVPMAAITALQALKLAKATKGKSILVYGSSGGVGTFLIHLMLIMLLIIKRKIVLHQIRSMTS